MRTIRRAFRGWRSVLRADRPTRIYTVALLTISAVFVLGSFAWHSLAYFGVVATPLPAFLTLWIDDSLPEYVEAAMLVVAVVCLTLAWWRTRDGLLLAWSIVILAMTADNRFRLHETAGAAWAAPFEPFGFGPVEGRHIAELVVWLVAAVVIVVVFALCWRSRTPIGVDANVVLLFLLIALVHFAAGYDLLHVLTKSNLAAFVEDGGELLCLALVSAYSFAVTRSVADPALRSDTAAPRDVTAAGTGTPP